MSEYCTAQDIKNRLTPLGYKFAVDRDGDGAVNAIDLLSVTDAIAQAGTEIDEAITAKRLITSTDARAQGSTILKFLAVDLASHRVAGDGGRKVPQSLQDSYDRATERLDRYFDGLLVDDLEYTDEGTGSNLPKAIDPARDVTARYHGRRRRWR